MRGAISTGIGGTSNGGVRDIQPDYSAEQALAGNPDAPVDRVILLLNGTVRTPRAPASATRWPRCPPPIRATGSTLAIFLVAASPGIHLPKPGGH